MTTQALVIPFGEWLPDLAEFNNPGATVAKNVIPHIQSFESLNAPAPFSDALDGQALGAFWLADSSNTIRNFAGDQTKLYQLLSGDTWTDETRTVGGAYTSGDWRFSKFGARVLAAGGADVIQFFDVDAPSAAFEDLPNAPVAQQIATIRDFVVVGDMDAFGPDFVGWSGFNNSEQWDLTAGSLATQSDKQQLFGRGGRIQAIVPGEYGMVFQEHSLWRMEYTGPPLVFQFDEIERRLGTPAGNSVVWHSEKVFYYGWDGFYLFDGRVSKPISNNRVSTWFKNEAAPDGLNSMRGAIDRRRGIVLWAFRTSTSSAFNNRLIIYNWLADKWAYAEVDTETITEYVSPGFDLDSLDGPLPAGIDTDSILIESEAFAGGQINVMSFDTSHISNTFDGTPLVAELVTKEISGDDHTRLMINSVRPLVEGTGGAAVVTVQIGTRNRQQDNVSFSGAQALNAINGEASVRENARYARIRLNVSGGFTHANGARANIRKSGGRQ